MLEISTLVGILFAIIAGTLAWNMDTYAHILQVPQFHLWLFAAGLSVIGGAILIVNSYRFFTRKNLGTDQYAYSVIGIGIVIASLTVFVLGNPGPGLGFAAALGVLIGGWILHYGVNHETGS